MRWGIRKERETHTFCRSESCFFSWVARLLWKSNTVCGLHRLPCEGPEWNNSGKSTFLITVSPKQEILRLGYFKTVYLITQLQNIGDFGYVVYQLVCSLVSSSELISPSKRYRGTKDMITMLLTCFHFIHQCWTFMPCQE